MFQKTKINSVHESVFHNYMSAQIFCHNTTLSYIFHCCTHHYLSFTNLVYFGCTNAYKTCSKEQKSTVCMNQFHHCISAQILCHNTPFITCSKQHYIPDKTLYPESASAQAPLISRNSML